MYLIFNGLIVIWNTKILNSFIHSMYLLKRLYIIHIFLLPINSVPQKSLGEEVNELTSSRLLKLEKDNQTLLKTVEELRGAASQDTVAKLSKVNQENQRLNQKVSNGLCIEGVLSGWLRVRLTLLNNFICLLSSSF